MILASLYRELLKQKLKTKVFLNYWEQIKIFISLLKLFQTLIKTTYLPLCLQHVMVDVIIYSVQFTYSSYNS